MVTTRKKLHRLVDELPADELRAAERYLEYLRNMADPLVRALMEAPEDDEPLTHEEDAAVREAEEEIGRGEGIPWANVRRRLLQTEETG
ncbi:MAG: hypothetical protein HYY04_00890 [Chloroflexi bacterium]|nr:hypothetical protein [Chloroflexota bacterium]